MSAAYVHGGLHDEEQNRLLHDEIHRAQREPAYDPAHALGGDGRAGARGERAPPMPVADENGYFAPPPQQPEPAPAQAHTPYQRHNATRRSTVTIMYQRLKLLSLIATTILSVPQIIAIAVVVPLNWHGWTSCDQPIKAWLFLLAGRQMCHLGLVYYLYCKPNAARSCSGFDSVVNVMQFILFILGMAWIIQSKTCSAADPHTYQLAYILFIVLVAVLCIPMVLLVLSLPIALCCQPCMHRMLGYWFGEKRGADADVLAGLSTETYRDGRFKDKNDAACSICSESYKDGDALRVLPCPSNLHHFHKECIDKWLKINASCPICRFHIGPQNNDGEEA